MQKDNPPSRKLYHKTTSIILLMVLGTILTILSSCVQTRAPSNIPAHADSFRFICEEENPHDDYNVTASCVQFEELEDREDYVHFLVRNLNTQEGVCYVNLTVFSDDSVIRHETLALGLIMAGEGKHYKRKMEPPPGKSQTRIFPFCAWE